MKNQLLKIVVGELQLLVVHPPQVRMNRMLTNKDAASSFLSFYLGLGIDLTKNITFYCQLQQTDKEIYEGLKTRDFLIGIGYQFHFSDFAISNQQSTKKTRSKERRAIYSK